MQVSIEFNDIVSYENFVSCIEERQIVHKVVIWTVKTRKFIEKDDRQESGKIL